MVLDIQRFFFEYFFQKKKTVFFEVWETLVVVAPWRPFETLTFI